jgi:hypothetical protein
MLYSMYNRVVRTYVQKETVRTCTKGFPGDYGSMDGFYFARREVPIS